MQGAIKLRFDRWTLRQFRPLVAALLAALLAAPAGAEEGEDKGGILSWFGWDFHDSRISDKEPGRLTPDFIPDRPARLELGNDFVGTGPISKGFVLPTGATWTPSFLLFGTHRTAVQLFDTGRPNASFSEWANRLDVFGNLILSGTERVTVSFRPFDEGFTGPSPTTGRFTGYYFNPEHGDFKKEFNADLIALFFEGDIGEIFPHLDREDQYPLDISFTVGRQALFYQEGILVFDTMDVVGVTKNSIRLPGTSNLQVSFLYAWNEINRGDNVEVNNLDLFGLFFAVDTPWSTINLDFIYAHDSSSTRVPRSSGIGERSKQDNEDGFYAGLSFVQRVGHLSTAFRAVASVATDEDADRIGDGAGPTSAVDTGVVLFGEIGWTPPHTRNWLYLTMFVGINDYTPAARTPGTGGPMGRAGLLFAGQGLGRYAAPVANFAQDVFGGTLGYQMILDGPAARRQLVLELGGRQDTNGADTATLASLLRFQQAFGRHILLQLDLFGAVGNQRSPGWGGRVEWRYTF